jgi:hypothetical protein
MLIDVDILSASMMSLTFSIARVEYVTLWLVVGVGPAAISNGSSPVGADLTSRAPPASGLGVLEGVGACAVFPLAIPLIATLDEVRMH